MAVDETVSTSELAAARTERGPGSPQPRRHPIVGFARRCTPFGKRPGISAGKEVPHARPKMLVTARAPSAGRSTQTVLGAESTNQNSRTPCPAENVHL